MSTKKGTKAGKAASSSLKSKSPAEFFAEHQNIAGFDNVRPTNASPMQTAALPCCTSHHSPPLTVSLLLSRLLSLQAGKSLYTTIREFVENSLDAAESINALPDISVTLERLDATTFNGLRGITAHTRKDASLYTADRPLKAAASKKKSADPVKPRFSSLVNDDDDDYDPLAPSTAPSSSSATSASAFTEEKEGEADAKGRQFFRVRCRDNGGGMAHASIPSMLGVVLSSTKYGVKQTRGKFGLGAKMALVWAKKSTGLPIEVLSAVDPDADVTDCVLDIDIHKNQPRVLRHERRPNARRWRGTEIAVVIEGNWTSYRAKVVKYFKQLAVITPYAQLTFGYTDMGSDKKSFALTFLRRTDVMPPQAVEVKHHPSSVDNLLVERLIHETSEKKLGRFLSREFSNISPQLATRLISELGDDFAPSTPIQALSKQQIHRLTTLLKEAKFDRPSADCLSPAGEYNLRLGIIKELRPEMVATFTDDPGVSEGHPFVVEAAVSLGGRCKAGLNIYRYANRIPLLFESGNDVVSVVCAKSVRWASYRIRMNADRIGVYVSIVSSKIPFKGTSKEYIGDDRAVLHASIKHAITQCCLQLKKRILGKQRDREKLERTRLLKRYIPDVSRAVWSVLNSIKHDGGAIRRWQDEQQQQQHSAAGRKRKAAEALEQPEPGISADTLGLYDALMKRMRAGEVDEERLSAALHVCVEKKNTEMVMEYVVEQGRKSGELDACQLGVMSSAQHDRLLNVFHPMLQLQLLR